MKISSYSVKYSHLIKKYFHSIKKYPPSIKMYIHLIKKYLPPIKIYIHSTKTFSMAKITWEAKAWLLSLNMTTEGETDESIG